MMFWFGFETGVAATLVTEMLILIALVVATARAKFPARPVRPSAGTAPPLPITRQP